MGEEPPKYQVEDVLNKKKPPPQILDLNGIMCVFVFPLSQFSTIIIAAAELKPRRNLEQQWRRSLTTGLGRKT